MPFLISLYSHVKLHVIIMSNTHVFSKFLESWKKLEEEKVELSAVEAMSVLGWKKSKVYYWISSGKFQIVERIDGQKILLSPSEIEKLKENKKVQENFESFENSEEVLESSVQNITESYKEVQKSLNSETFEFFNKSLETIKQIHQSSLQNYGYSLKLLTDGQSAIEKEIIELKQEKKSVEESLRKSENQIQENLKQFEKMQKEKNIIIAILVSIILLACFMFFLVSNGFVQF